MVVELKYIGAVTPYDIPGVGIVNQGDNFKVSSDRAEYFLAQAENFAAVPKAKEVK
jgi:hypothetical protein